MDIIFVSKKNAIDEIEDRIKFHEEGMMKSDTYSFRNRGARRAWAGHRARIIALEQTLAQINAGKPCNRAVAQLFGKGFRIYDDE